MTDFLPRYRLDTPEEMHDVISYIIKRSMKAAYNCEYDVPVFVHSVQYAQDVFDAIPVEKTAMEYGEKVEDALCKAWGDFYDSDGEYTSRGMIGDVYFKISELVEKQKEPTLRTVDRQEALECLREEMETLTHLASSSMQGDITDTLTTVKTDVKGESGVKYYIKMQFETSVDGQTLLNGSVFMESNYRHVLLKDCIIAES